MKVDSMDLITKCSDFIFINNLPKMIPITPQSRMFATVAPINVEYFANGPSVSTACDSISPEVIEINPWEAISGMNNPLIVNFKKIDNDRLAIPAARPKRKNTM